MIVLIIKANEFKIVNGKIESCNVGKQCPNVVEELMQCLRSNENVNKDMKYNRLVCNLFKMIIKTNFKHKSVLMHGKY